MLGLYPVEDEVGFVDWFGAIVGDQDGEFLKWIVFWCLGSAIPGHFCLESEGDAFLSEDYAHFSCVG